MNAVANKSPRRRAPRSIVAKLDLSDPGQRRLHGLIARMHGGRQPTLRALDMRQIGNAIHEAVQWFPTATLPIATPMGPVIARIMGPGEDIEEV